MSYTHLSSQEVKARKDYRCIWCGEDIPKGTRYLREASIYDGEFQDHKWHPECVGASNASGEIEFDPGGEERPPKPDLIKIKKPTWPHEAER